MEAMALAFALEPENTCYWAPEDQDECAEAGNLAQLGKVPLQVLQRFPGHVEMVCGPISTGGRSIQENLRIFRFTIDRLKERGHYVFDQLPLEEHIQRLIRARDPKTNLRLLEQVYLPLLESGRVRLLNFIHDWQASQGARWEREQGERLGLELHDLPPDFLQHWP